MSENKKDCLCFAHKGEASHFLQTKTTLLEQSSFSFWETENYFVLVSGEGIEEALHALTYCLAIYGNKILKVINAGIAGSLKVNIEKQQIYSVSVILAEGNNEQAAFKSMLSKDSQTPYYCISARARVKEDSYAENLSLFADMVDREAYGFAFAAKQAKKEFLCYKLISDRAGKDTFCFDIKELASKYSEALFDFYQNSLEKKPFQTKKNTEGRLLLLLKEKGFHYSQTQKNQIQKLLNYLEKKSPELWKNICSIENLTNISEDYPRPKDRTRVFLDEVQSALNPFHNQMYDKLQTWFSQRPRAIKQIQTDPQWEKEYIRLNLEIYQDEDIKDIKLFLDNLPLSEFQDVFKGKF